MLHRYHDNAESVSPLKEEVLMRIVQSQAVTGAFSLRGRRLE